MFGQHNEKKGSIVLHKWICVLHGSLVLVLETLVALQNCRREGRTGAEHRCQHLVNLGHGHVVRLPLDRVGFKLRRRKDDILLLQTARLFWFIAHSVTKAHTIMQIREADGFL